MSLNGEMAVLDKKQEEEEKEETTHRQCANASLINSGQ
jgi:hypothetical protein